MNLIVITGSSQGFGRSIALALKNKPAAFLLCARNRERLEETKLLMDCTNISTAILDLSKPIHKDFFDQYKTETYKHAILINNAGSLGPLESIENLKYDDIAQTLAVNVTGPIALTSLFLSSIKADKVTIINISSLAAIQPFEYWSLYCASKSAMEMFYRCLLEEGKSKVLNYAPGPLDTDMQGRVRTDMPECDTRETYRNMKVNGELVDPALSAKVLVDLIDKDDWVNGAHVDFYDVMQ